MMYSPRPGDAVRYVGERLSKKYPDLMKRDKIREVISTVLNSELVVVSFGSDDFLCHPESLVRHTFKEKEAFPGLDKVVKKWEPAEG